MSAIKIVFFDIDGTLIDMNKKRISEKMLETLRRLKENGTIICIATGRSPIALPHFEGVEFDAFLTFNGSYCFTEDADIFSNPIPTEDVHMIIQNATALGRPLTVATKNRLASNGKDEDLIEYYSFAKQEIDVADDFEQVANEKVYQLMAGSSLAEHPALMKDVSHARITFWWNRAVDIIPTDGGKGRGIEKMLEYYHFDKSQAMAFGDGNNDIEMLKSVGQGVAMANAFGAAAAPMGFGEVYTAIQQGVIDGAENNELALTNNKHGEVAKYYTYNKHQMVPDMLVANLKFLNSLSPEEYQVFKEAAQKSTEVELEEWDKSIDEAKKIATDDMGVEFIDVDVNAFKQKVLPLHEKMLNENPKIRDLYEHIQEANEAAAGKEGK